ncbi:MAG: PepSY domain-containing protein [Pseudanabaenaceae cyanobacterium]
MQKYLCGGVLIALILSSGSGLAWASQGSSRRERASVPVEQAIECLRAAVAAQPGQIWKLDIERWRDGRLVCEVDIISGFDKFEVEVDATTRQVLRVKFDD